MDLREFYDHEEVEAAAQNLVTVIEQQVMKAVLDATEAALDERVKRDEKREASGLKLIEINGSR